MIKKGVCGYSTSSKLDDGQLYLIWWSNMLDITHWSLAAELDASPKSLNPVRHDLGNAPSRSLQAQLTCSGRSTNTRRIMRMQFVNKFLRDLAALVVAIAG
jgi:hypothetical protein